jgi:hypothetical protein
MFTVVHGGTCAPAALGMRLHGETSHLTQHERSWLMPGAEWACVAVLLSHAWAF